MPVGERPHLPHLPALDGLRALAVASVFAYHADVRWASGGFLGVDVFFVISGFLITALLLTEWRRDAWLDVVYFWKRRALRLLPAVLVLLVAVWVAVPSWPRTRPAGCEATCGPPWPTSATGG